MTEIAIVTLDQFPNYDLMSVAGEIDLSNAPDLLDRARLSLHRAAAFVLDLSAIQFLDSAGIRLLDSIAIESAEMGNRFVVVGNPVVGRLIEVAGLEQVVDVVDSQAAAISAATT